MPRKMKSTVMAPCMYIDKDAKKTFPAVNCGYNCDSCGWNPAEAQRRRETCHIEETVLKHVVRRRVFKGRDA